jgi:hypothetical protein
MCAFTVKLQVNWLQTSKLNIDLSRHYIIHMIKPLVSKTTEHWGYWTLWHNGGSGGRGSYWTFMT